MRTSSFAVAAVTALTAAALGLAGVAAAAPTVPAHLSGCTATGVHGVPTTVALPGQRLGTIPITTDYLDISCSDHH